MALLITKFTDFDTSSITFSNLRKNKNGGKTVYLNNGPGNKKMMLQLPYMRAPFGLSQFTDENTKKTSYNLDLSFDDGPEINQVRAQLEALDDTIVNLVAKNSTEWLGKKYNVNVIKEALYKPLVRLSKGDYAPTLKLKVLKDYKGECDFVPEAYALPSREQVPLDSIEKGQKVLPIIEFNSIWFIDNKFGVSVRLKQVLLEPSKKLPAFAFQGLDDPEEEDEEEFEEEEVDA